MIENYDENYNERTTKCEVMQKVKYLGIDIANKNIDLLKTITKEFGGASKKIC